MDEKANMGYSFMDKTPTSLTEIKPGETTAVNLTMNNDATETATAAEISYTILIEKK